MGKNRLIVDIALGYVIGIMWGLYLNISMVPIYFIIFLIFKLISFTKFYRYLKLILKQSTIIVIIISSFISNLIIVKQETKYKNLYCNVKEVDAIAIVMDNGIYKSSYNQYKIKIKILNNDNHFQNTYLILKTNKVLNYGDMIKINGNYEEANSRRNYKGFDYRQYLKTQKVYGILKAKSVEILEKNKVNTILKFSNYISNKIKHEIDEHFDSDASGILQGILLGNKEKIAEEIKENFSKSNIAHILAVSGMHISYIIIRTFSCFK